MSPARLSALLAATTLLAACETTGGLGPSRPPRPPQEAPPSATVFRPGDFSWSAVPGRNRIEGALTFNVGGQRYSCSGAAVILTPETPWTRRRMTLLYNSPTAAALPADEVRARTPSAPRDDYSAFLKRTTCDSSDRFSFAGLADGSWFVITLARPAAGRGPTMAIMKRVETRRGRLVKVEL